MTGRGDKDAINRSYVPKARALYSIAFRISRYCRQHDLDWVVNVAKRAGIKQAFGSRGAISPMSERTRGVLTTQFAPDIERLELRLGISLAVWRNSGGAASRIAAQ